MLRTFLLYVEQFADVHLLAFNFCNWFIVKYFHLIVSFSYKQIISSLLNNFYNQNPTVWTLMKTRKQIRIQMSTLLFADFDLNFYDLKL